MNCNPTVKDIFEFIDSLAPFSTQCDWDNSGMLVGDRNKTVRKIAVVLDITTEAIEKGLFKLYELPFGCYPNKPCFWCR